MSKLKVILMMKMTAVIAMILFSAHSSQAADFTRCFTHGETQKGLIHKSNGGIELIYSVEFYPNGEPIVNSTTNTAGGKIYWEKNVGSAKLIAADTSLVEMTDNRLTDENDPPVVVVTIDEKFVSFFAPYFDLKFKYPIVPCH